MRGKAIPLSVPRRCVGDLLHFARQVPTVVGQRRMPLRPLVQARAAAPERPGWTAIFTKAYAMMARAVPEIRRAYVKFPWAHLYEYPDSVASITVARTWQGEPIVTLGRIGNPAAMPLVDLDRKIRSFSQDPVEQLPNFRHSQRIGRLPWFLRRPLWWLGLNLGRQRPRFFGTFLVTVYSGLGAEALHPLSPLTTTLTYGIIDDNGSVDVRIVYDHRVLDGAIVAHALTRLENVLLTDIVAEVQSLSNQPSPRLRAG